MTIKFRQFQKNHTCLTSYQTTSDAPIGDLIAAFCTHFTFRKSHERTAPNAVQKFFTNSKTELGAFFYPKRNTRVNICEHFGNHWDIKFNPLKSQLMTFGGSNPIMAA